MGRLFVLVIVVGLALLAVAVVLLGAFPPDPHQHQIEKVLPNDRFQHAT